MQYSRYLSSFILGTLSLTALSAAPFTDTGSIYNQVREKFPERYTKRGTS